MTIIPDGTRKHPHKVDAEGEIRKPDRLKRQAEKNQTQSHGRTLSVIFVMKES